MIWIVNNVFIFLCLTPYITLSTLLTQEVCCPRESSFVTQRIERSSWVNSYPKKLRYEISSWEVKGLNRDSWATYKHIWFSYIHNFTKNTLLKFCLLHIPSSSKYKSVYIYEMYIQKKRRKKYYKVKGGNRVWTGDLSICSRMLYHWAMPPLMRCGDPLKLLIIRCNFFLFIGQEPTTWPANNGLLMRNVTQLCLATNNILLSRIWNHTFLLLAISVLCENGRSIRFPKIFIKNQTRWSNDKTSVLNSIVAKHLDDEPGCTW